MGSDSTAIVFLTKKKDFLHISFVGMYMVFVLSAVLFLIIKKAHLLMLYLFVYRVTSNGHIWDNPSFHYALWDCILF